MRSMLNPVKTSSKERLFIVAGLFLALLVGLLAVFTQSYVVPLIPVVLLAVIVFFILLFREPLVGLYTTIFYCFFLFVFSREIGGDISYGLGTEVLLLTTWISVWYNARRYDFSVFKTPLLSLLLIWLVISILQIVNPTGASIRGWLQEIRSTAIYPLLIAALGLLLIDNRKKMNAIISLIILFSFIAFLNGMKQQLIGLSAGEQAFLDEGGNVTHMIFGQLRIFSFYSNAGQFGPSQAQLSVMCLVLALGVKKWAYKIILVLLAGFFFYGMLLSGTRGALFALIGAACFAIFLGKKFKVLLLGSIVLLLFYGFLKYTNIGSSNYHIVRLRTSVDPKDPSLNVRFENQEKLANYLRTRPFGGGLGVIGAFGHKYNSDKFLSTIEPDSYWVKLWAMYGIVGFTIWFCFFMYLLGYSTGIIWRVKNTALKIKLIALASGIAGLFVCSYGNEVMNDMPSLLIIYLSFAIIYRAAWIEKQEQQKPVIITELK